MTHTFASDSDSQPITALPEFSASATPEDRLAAWSKLIADGDTVPEEQLDRALFKLLEEIRLSL